MPPLSNKRRSLEQVNAGRRPAGTAFAADAVTILPADRAPTTASPRFSGVRRIWLTAAALAALTFVTFVPALRCGFINWDDPSYVLENSHVRDGLNWQDARWAFTTFGTAAKYWHPLTWLSLQLDATLWKTPTGSPDPAGFHLTNVLLHAANAALLFLALHALTNAFWRSLAVSLLFAVHPLRVESVAWVAERKDVLSLFFGLAALWAYARYVRYPSMSRYLLVVLSFALSLLCKPMLVTLPCLLLVLDWWPLGRWPARAAWPLIREKLPLFAMTAASIAVTIVAQAALGAPFGVKLFTPAVRVLNAVVGYEAYLTKTFWPTPLAILYTHPVFTGVGLEPLTVAVAVILLATLTAVAIVFRQRAPYLLAGWLWYLGSLVPVIGLVQAGSQAYADRFSYFPQVGILIAVCWGATAVVGARPRTLLTIVAAAAAVLAVVTWRQLSFWHDSATVWKHTLDVVPASPLALTSYGTALGEQGKTEQAARVFERAIALDPTYPEAYYNLAVAMQTLGQLPKAVELLEKLCKLEPRSSRGPVLLAGILYWQGKLPEAAACLEKTVKIAPESSGIYCNLGLIEMARSHPERAAECYRSALRLRPKLAEAHNGLGGALVKLGRVDEGIAEFHEAIRCDPRSGQAHNNLGHALEDRGEFAAAIEHYEAGAQASPEVAMIWFNLGRGRLRQGRVDDAAECFERSVARDPRKPEFQTAYVDTLNRLAAALTASGRFGEAATAAERARDAATSAGRPDVARQIEGQLEHYRRGEAGGGPATVPGGP